MHWNFSHHDNLYTYEANSKKSIMEYADKWYSRYCQQYNMKNGEVSIDEVTLIQENESGEVISTEPYEVIYEHYHGDFKEHSNYGM